ncbi:hypothetical protein PN497_20675 [Sphaerospermopsis kisseleviana CS-549]|uniref:Chromosome segregation in meiosis protein 3 domain-containing protein n=1 Tax=Sphaerospermopsis kisseleviana CS-549 TaxID=3021783 RepID=A0ABT4ZXJ8_9CYAN|nr:hypothetical protein [Sphaerospermopsis kisseleviana]MDB9443745.1 hypothetical protein [Sphaerospermopsis kisseleviana CS-549]BAZ79682.1 hypothetical protein NIES73_09270 [Sphaerospermopsis kisseleviana NIES-73]
MVSSQTSKNSAGNKKTKLDDQPYRQNLLKLKKKDSKKYQLLSDLDKWMRDGYTLKNDSELIDLYKSYLEDYLKHTPRNKLISKFIDLLIEAENGKIEELHSSMSANIANASSSFLNFSDSMSRKRHRTSNEKQESSSTIEKPIDDTSTKNHKKILDNNSEVNSSDREKISLEPQEESSLDTSEEDQKIFPQRQEDKDSEGATTIMNEETNDNLSKLPAETLEDTKETDSKNSK